MNEYQTKDMYIIQTHLRYLEGKVSEKVEMLPSSRALLPAFTLCPQYDYSYNRTALKVQNKIYLIIPLSSKLLLTIKMFNLTVDKYARDGDFVGNASTHDSAAAIKIYNKVNKIYIGSWKVET